MSRRVYVLGAVGTRRAVTGRGAGRGFAARRQEAGQALLLGVLLAGTAAVALVSWFGLAQLAGLRTRLTHAVDAAAYSGALAQARALNMMAYLNRTQLAHQLAMAHLVTLGAWAHWGGRMGAQAMAGNPPSYAIQMLFGPAHGRAYDAARRASGLASLPTAQGAIGQALARHQQVLDTVFERTRDRLLATLPDVRLAAIRAVLDQHLQHERGVAAHALRIEDDGWPGYVQQHDGPDYLRAFVRDLASRYAFLDPRHGQAASPWVVDPRCPHLRHQLRRRGDTQMDDQGHWSASDTQSFHAVRANRWVGCYYREYAMGWGWMAPADARFEQPHATTAPADFSTQDFWRWVTAEAGWGLLDEQGNPLANTYAVAQRLRWSGGGLRAVADVAAGRAHEPLRFTVSWQTEHAQGQRLTLRTAAESYYARPPGSGGGQEAPATLFLPYWLARLADVPPVARPRHGRMRLGGERRVASMWCRRGARSVGGRTSAAATRGEKPHFNPIYRAVASATALKIGAELGPFPTRFAVIRSTAHAPRPACRRASRPRVGWTGGARCQQRGQALSEAVVLLGWLALAWLAVNELGRWQDMALQASHASRHAVFAMARGEAPEAMSAWRTHYFSDTAHRWQDRQGRSLLGEDGAGVQLALARTASLPAAAQPAGEDGQAHQLRAGWGLADSGILQGRVTVRNTQAAGSPAGRQWLAAALSSVQHHAYILTDSGHADDDLQAQRRAAASGLAWADASAQSAAVVARVGQVLAPVDAAWRRPVPTTDWWTAWAGSHPGSMSAQGEGGR